MIGTFRSLGLRFWSIVSVALFTGFLADPARALDYEAVEQTSLGNCSLLASGDPMAGNASLSITSGTLSDAYLAPYWLNSQPVSPPSAIQISVELLQSCGFTNVRNLRADFADGTYADDSFMGFAFYGLGPEDSEDQSYVFAILNSSGSQFLHLGIPLGAPPSVGPIAPLTVAPGDEVTRTATATDPDSEQLFYTWLADDTNSVDVELQHPGPETITFTAPQLPDGVTELVLNFSVTVSDGVNEVTVPAVVTVRQENTPPTVAIPIPSLTARAGTSVEIGAVGADAEGAVTYSWRQTDSTGIAATIDDSTASTINVALPRLPRGQDQTLTFEVTATDEGGLTATAYAYVTVQAPNNAPDVTDKPTIYAHPGDFVAMSVTASDLDNDRLFYFWRRTNGTFNDWQAPLYPDDYTTDSPSFTVPTGIVVPPEGLFISYDVDVSDGDSTTTGTARVLVLPPALTVELGNSIATDPFQTVTLSPTVQGRDTSNLTFEWSQIDSSGVTVSLSPPGPDGAVSFTAPDVRHSSQPLFLVFKVTVTDGAGNVATDTVDVKVNPRANTPPSVESITETEVNAGTTARLGVSASDEDGDNLSYFWTYLDNGNGYDIQLSDPRAKNPTFSVPNITRANAPLTLYFKVVVSDGTDQAEGDVYAVVIPANAVPDLTVSPDETVTEGDRVTVTVSATDADNDPIDLTLDQIDGQMVALQNGAPGRWEFVAPRPASGPSETLVFLAIANDGQGGSGQKTITITVNRAPNRPPVVTFAPNLTVDADQPFTLSPTIEDPDGDSLTYQWSIDPGYRYDIPLTDADKAAVSFVAPRLPRQAGQVLLFVNLNVSDGQESTNIDIPVTLVAPENNAPDLTISDDMTVTAGQRALLTASATDLDDDGVSLTLTQTDGPEAAVTSDQPGEWSILAPPVSETTTLRFRVTADDGQGGTAEKTFTLTVRPAVNRPPEIASFVTNKDVTGGNSTRLFVMASDPDGDALSYLWEQVDDTGLTATPDDPTADQTMVTLPTIPKGTPQKDLFFRVTVSDGIDSVTRSVRVGVLAPLNTDPSVSAGDDADVQSGGLAALSATAEDADGDKLYYNWRQIDSSGYSVTIRNPTSRFANFTAPTLPAGASPAVLEFEVTVDDGYGGSATDTVKVTVLAPLRANQQPDVTTTTLVEVASGASVTLTAQGTDPDGDSLTYEWTQTGGDTVSLTGAGSASTSFTAPLFSTAVSPTRDLFFSVTVRDPGGLSKSVAVTLRVTGYTPLSLAEAFPDLTIFEGSTIRFSAQPADGTGGGYGYGWTLNGLDLPITGDTFDYTGALADLTDGKAVIGLRVDDQGTPPDAPDFVTDAADVAILPATGGVAAGDDLLAGNGDEVTLSGSVTGTDYGNLAYSWAQTNAPGASVTFVSGKNSATPKISLPDLPVGSPPVEYALTLTVTDGFGGSSSDTLIITQSPPPNQPPAITDITSPTGNSGALVSLSVTANDPEGGRLSYAWSQAKDDTYKVRLTGSDTATPSFTAPAVPAGQSAVLNFSVTVSDGIDNASLTTTVTVNGPPVNQPPVISAITSPTANSGAHVTLEATARDPDGGPTLFSWTQSGTDSYQVTLTGAGTATPSFTAPTVPAGQSAVLNFTVTVSDGIDNATRSTTVTVNGPTANRAPTAVLAVASEFEGVYRLTGADSSDPDGDSLTYAFRQTDGPELSISTVEKGITFYIPPLSWQDDPVTYTFALTVTDPGDLSDETTLSVTVNPADDRPALVADFSASSTTVRGGDSFTLDATASTGDGEHELTYAWATDPSDISIAPTATPTLTAPVYEAEEVVTITLTVTEDEGGAFERSASVSRTVTVTPNPAPQVRIDAPRTAVEGSTVTMDASASLAGDDDPLTFRWSQSQGPLVDLSFDQTGTIASFIAPTLPDNVQRLALMFRLSVSDGANPPVTQNVTITITRGDDPTKEQQAIVTAVLQIRMTSVISNQPDLSGFLLGGGDGGNGDVTVSSMGGTLDLGTPLDQPYWARLKGSWSRLEGADSGYFLGAAGTHVKLGDRLALGVMGQIDHLSVRDGAARATGTGWLVGPYVVTQLADQPLALQGRLLYGQTANTISPIGTYSDDFDTTRLLGQVGLSGRIVKGPVTWQPSLNAAYARERSDSYTDSLGGTVPAQTDAMAEVAAGLSVTFPLAVPSGSMTGTLGLTDIWSHSLQDASDAATDGHRGRLSFGVARAFASGADLSVIGSYDGIGRPDYENLSIDLSYQHKF